MNKVKFIKSVATALSIITLSSGCSVFPAKNSNNNCSSKHGCAGKKHSCGGKNKCSSKSN